MTRYSYQPVDIRASWGPTQWQQKHYCSVRGVPVTKLQARDGIPDGYSWCMFPDYRVMLVAEKNIKAVRINKHYGEIEHVQQAA